MKSTDRTQLGLLAQEVVSSVTDIAVTPRNVYNHYHAFILRILVNENIT